MRECYKLLRAAPLLETRLLLQTNLTQLFKKWRINMASDSYKELIVVERKTRKLTIDTLLNDNDNIQILLKGFDIEGELPIALSGRKSRDK